MPDQLAVSQLSVAEKIQLAQDLWDSVAANPDDVPVSSAMRTELDRRLERLVAHPEESIPWSEAKVSVGGPR